jgi:Zinc-binding dehydrogenase
LYNSNPNGIGLVPPVTPEGRGKYAGNPIVILGGSGSVGQNGKPLKHHMSVFSFDVNYTAIQLAKLSGFSPIITTASLKHTESLKSLGATHVIDRNISSSALASEVASITQNTPLKYAADAISLGDTQQAAYDLLAPGGQLATFLPVAVKTTQEKHIFSTIGLVKYPSNVELLNTLFHDNFERLLKEGDVKVGNGYKYFVFLTMLTFNWIISAKQS